MQGIYRILMVLEFSASEIYGARVRGAVNGGPPAAVGGTITHINVSGLHFATKI